MILSGSHEMPVAALVFEKDGTMKLLLMSAADPAEAASISLVADYFQYAIAREDWMTTYADFLLEEGSSQKESHKSKRSHLRVIKGGKSDTSGSKSNKNVV